MGMGGFVLQDEGYEMFPIVFGADLIYLDKYIKMEPRHFKFKNFYPVEKIGIGQILRYET
jgi:hypothetical protein